VALGLVLVMVGLLAWTGALSRLCRLPGDLRFGGGNVRVHIPITSMLLVWLVASIVLSALIRLFRR
jgi:hypothetical protein